MGANLIHQVFQGTSAQDAFETAWEQARVEYGTDPYSGTIATFYGFEELPAPKGTRITTRIKAVEELSIGCSAKRQAMWNRKGFSGIKGNRVGQKWGDAGIMQLSKNQWLIWGWAAS